MAKPLDLEGIVNQDLYSNPMPQIDGVKQVLETLQDRVQALTPTQMQAIGYLEYLQTRGIHDGNRPYSELIDRIQNHAYRVAPPGFFIRVIEALIPRPTTIDAKTAAKMNQEREGNR
ncbi:hypothetical protein NYE44_30560 [Paenibacillus sp. FSL L8-0493]|uniref:hypothetical protein n=1 Tax=Paenibacillus sp. FSL L8-0493 TaxID=2975333 RepID=UPI0030FD7063